MKFAVIETGGKQYRIRAGQKIKVEKLNAADGASFVFDKVLLIADSRGTDADKRGKDWDVRIGAPYLAGEKVSAKVLKQGREKKKIVFRYHSKTRYRKKKGHRQHFTEVEIVNI